MSYHDAVDRVALISYQAYMGGLMLLQTHTHMHTHTKDRHWKPRNRFLSLSSLCVYDARMGYQGNLESHHLWASLKIGCAGTGMLCGSLLRLFEWAVHPCGERCSTGLTLL